MKTPLLKNLKLWILAGITGLSFLSSLTVSGNEDYYPCYKEGTITWTGKECICVQGYTGKCCEVDQMTNESKAKCSLQ